MLVHVSKITIVLCILIFLFYFFAESDIGPHTTSEVLFPQFISTKFNTSNPALQPPKAPNTLRPSHHSTLTPPKNFWTAQDGKFLPGSLLMSQNQQYTLSLALTGEIQIHRKRLHEHGAPKLIFWTNNGFQWQGAKWAEMTSEGRFVTLHQEREDMGIGVTWSSELWRECQRGPVDGMSAVLVLGEDGGLRILHISSDVAAGFGEDSIGDAIWNTAIPVCEIFTGDDVGNGEDMGRLAVLLVGGLRSYKHTCHDMNTKIFDRWEGSRGVDVFVATLDEEVWHNDNETVTWASVDEDLRDCFGERFKVLEHVPGRAVDFPDLEETRKCKTGEPLSPGRVLNMLYHVDRGRQMMMKYMIQNGVMYDYVLRMRPDHMVWGDAIPHFESLDIDTILYPMPYWDDPVYSTTHTGTSSLTPTDQAAFGRLLPMTSYLSLYNSYANLVKTQQLPGAIDSPPCYEPSNPCPYVNRWPCFIEGVMGYWARLNGIRVRMDWRWKWNLRRFDGELAKVWHGPWNESQVERLVENAFE